jgi:rare lipoprotein A
MTPSTLPVPAAPHGPAARRESPVRARRVLACLSLVALALIALPALEPADALGREGKQRARPPKREMGLASWYGPGFHGRRTASGERFDPGDMTAAHRSHPFGTRIRVTNLENGRRVVLRVNDRGPFKKGRVVDVTPIAARRLGFQHLGTTRVRVDVLKRPREGARLAGS